MKTVIILFISGILALFAVQSKQGKKVNQQSKTMSDTIQYKKLTPEEEYVIVHKGTESPFTGKYYNNHENGIYVCKRCGAALYRSTDKFDSGCGWPSFDD
jgi:peptide-methionine (R)-S-oxide reductase